MWTSCWRVSQHELVINFSVSLGVRGSSILCLSVSAGVIEEVNARMSVRAAVDIGIVIVAC